MARRRMRAVQKKGTPMGMESRMVRMPAQRSLVRLRILAARRKGMLIRMGFRIVRMNALMNMACLRMAVARWLEMRMGMRYRIMRINALMITARLIMRVARRKGILMGMGYRMGRMPVHKFGVHRNIKAARIRIMMGCLMVKTTVPMTRAHLRIMAVRRKGMRMGMGSPIVWMPVPIITMTRMGTPATLMKMEMGGMTGRMPVLSILGL